MLTADLHIKHGLLCKKVENVNFVQINLIDSKFYLDRTIVYISGLCFAGCVAGLAQRNHVL